MRDQSLWTWHVGAGVIILIFLGLHMGIMHLDYTLGIFNFGNYFANRLCCFNRNRFHTTSVAQKPQS